MLSKIVFDPKRCTGCRVCEIMCSVRHEQKINPRKARIKVHVNSSKPASNKISVCRQCKLPPCKKACPEGAIEKNQETGIFSIREDKCTGCAACVEACPFGAIFMHPAKNLPFMCDLCGGKPECVIFCTTNALKVIPEHLVAIEKNRKI